MNSTGAANQPAKVPRTPLMILGLMTVVCFGGPFGVAWVLRGGSSTVWPPDRPVEWAALIGSCVLVAALMVVLLFMNLNNMKEMKRIRAQHENDRKQEAP